MVKYNEGINDLSILEQQIEIVADLALRLEMETNRAKVLKGMKKGKMKVTNPLSDKLLIIWGELKVELEAIKKKWKDEDQGV